MIQHIFVYGTLKRGQCREGCWPLKPRTIQEAWTFGELYDTGPFPAMVAGSDRVAGEIWSYEMAELPVVFETLDEIEGTNQPGSLNDYDREIVDVFGERGVADPIRAYTYLFARRELLETFERLLPTVSHGKPRCASWPPSLPQTHRG